MKRGYERTFTEAVIVQSHPNPLARYNALVLVLRFAGLVAAGTILLRLPAAGAARPLTWSEAFFTATSAVTVTGLGVVTTALDLSLFGQVIVLLLMEIGGIGFIAFSVLLFALIGRRLGIAERLLLRQSLGVFETVGIGQLTRYVLIAALGIQAVAAFLLWLRWWPAVGAARAAYLAVFHSISAFCNAGFDLFSGTGAVLFGFGRDPFTLTVLMVLIIIGGLGLLVMIDLVTYPWDRRLTTHTKLTLVLSGLLTLVTLCMLLIDAAVVGPARGRTIDADEFWAALFTAVSTRTAGLAIFPLETLSDASVLVLMGAMFIGGAPASMAGGVTLSTVGVILATLVATVRGQPQVVIFGRTLPLETLGKAVAIMTVSTLVCFGVTLFLLLSGAGELLPIAFEVVSAFSNTGYTLGATAALNDAGRALLALTMFWGRLGPLTLVVLLAQREQPTRVRYPTEKIVIG